MSEQKTAETPAEVKDEGVNLDAPEVKEEAAKETTDNQETDSDAGEEVQPKKLSGAQRAKIREARLLNDNAELQRRLDEASRKAPAETASEDKPPREEDYNGDWFAFQSAKTAYDAGKAVRDEIRKDRETREASERTTKQAETARERDIAHMERVEEAKGIIADYDEAMKGMQGVHVRNELIEEIKSSEKGALIAYHLAQNPHELAAMDGMNSRELARAMGRLEEKLKFPTAKKKTDAPPPLEPLKGGAAGSFNPATASMDDYVAKRQAGWKG